ncbi:outer membrane beta-barrel protein [Ornithobacterium rhinotracheale]
MRTIIYPALFLVGSISLAQNQQVNGRVVDSLQVPIAYAEVILRDLDTEKENQILTDSDGRFELQADCNRCVLSVESFGFKPYQSSEFSILEKQDFATIKLNPASLALKEVIATGREKPVLVTLKPGKVIYNVENTADAYGSTALDVLRKTPKLTIDGGNAIRINGKSKVLVLINGKNTYLQPEQLVNFLKATTSGNIKNIEVMTNPPVEYEAEGSAGVVNIVLKKATGLRNNFFLNAGLSSGVFTHENLDLSFNYHYQKFNFYGNFSRLWGKVNYLYGNHRLANGQEIFSDSYDVDKKTPRVYNFGVDYKIDDNQTLNLQIGRNRLHGTGFVKTQNNVRTPSLIQNVKSLSDYFFQDWDRGNISLNYDLKNAKSETKLSVDYAKFMGDTQIRLKNDFFDQNKVAQREETTETYANRDIDAYAFSASQQRDLGKIQLKYGFKTSFANSSNDFKRYDLIQAKPVLNINESNVFDFKENITAIFAHSAIEINSTMRLGAGLRVERTSNESHIEVAKGSSHKPEAINSTYVDYFPSLQFSYKPNDLEYSLSFSKRIDRPQYSDLNTLDQPIDAFSSWRGNPYLKPQKTDKVAVGILHKQKQIELFYSKTHDYKVNMQIVENGIMLEIPKNMGTQEHLGLDVSYVWNILQWHFNFSGQAFYLKNKVKLKADLPVKNHCWATNLSLNVNARIFWKMNLDIFTQYNSGQLSGATVTSRPMNSTDFSLSRAFLNNKAKVKLSVVDVFNSSHWNSVNEYPGFYSDNYGRGERRQIKLNISYKIGWGENHDLRESNMQSELDRI